MQKKELIFKGNEKEVFATDNPNQVIFRYTDVTVAYNNIKRARFVGKGVLDNQISAILLDYLNQHGIETHFIEVVGPDEQLCRKIEIIPLQVVVHINTLKLFYAESQQLQNVRNHLNESFGHQYPSEFTPEDLHYYADSPDELAVINYTSGTSGFSKGVMIPYRSLWSNMEFGFRKFPELKAGDNVVSMLPLAHMLGLMFDFLMEMALGMHVHFLTRMPSPKIIVEAMETVKPRIIVAVPLIVEKIYRAKLRPILDRNRFFFRIPLLDQYLRKRIKDELTATFGGNFLELVVGGAAVNPEVVLNIIDEKALSKSGKETDRRKVSPREWHEMYLDAVDDIPSASEKAPSRCSGIKSSKSALRGMRRIRKMA